MDEFFTWVASARALTPGRNLATKALGYALNQEPALCRFLEDGRIEPDNNDTERALRHVVTGRKAWLFAGNDEGGRRNAVLSTLVYSCKVLGIDPVVYLTDILKKADDAPGSASPRAHAEAVACRPQGGRSGFGLLVTAELTRGERRRLTRVVRSSAIR